MRYSPEHAAALDNSGGRSSQLPFNTFSKSTQIPLLFASSINNKENNSQIFVAPCPTAKFNVSCHCRLPLCENGCLSFTASLKQISLSDASSVFLLPGFQTIVYCPLSIYPEGSEAVSLTCHCLVIISSALVYTHQACLLLRNNRLAAKKDSFNLHTY